MNFWAKKSWRQCHPPLSEGDFGKLESLFGRLPTSYERFLRTVHGRFMPFGYGIQLGGKHGCLEVEFAAAGKQAGSETTTVYDLIESMDGATLPFGFDANGGIFFLDPDRDWSVVLTYAGEMELVERDFGGFLQRFELDEKFYLTH